VYGATAEEDEDIEIYY
jgi:hypothetical protein